jgi:uncharacterized damage-inducible protein DinB/predicted RNase H-like HicB family nuclease
MRIRLTVEDIELNHWIAWALDLPGCYSSARTMEAAIANASKRVGEYFAWLTKYDHTCHVIVEPMEIKIVETFQSRASREDPEYLVNAFFDDDRRPLGYWEVEIALRLLDWTRQDLLSLLHSIPSEQLTRIIPGEVRGSIAGILNHIAIAENWYFGQLGLGTADLPDSPFEKMDTVRDHTRDQLVKLVGNEQILQHCDELWSGRKIVRRALWHERDHTQHIQQLLSV